MSFWSVCAAGDIVRSLNHHRKEYADGGGVRITIEVDEEGAIQVDIESHDEELLTDFARIASAYPHIRHLQSTRTDYGAELTWLGPVETNGHISQAVARR